jgi:hypothetical protein
MNKPFWLGLSLTLLSSAGCFSLPMEPFAPKSPTAVVRPALRPVPPVTADQIGMTGESGHQVADNLGEELDRETQKSSLAPLPR